MEPPPNQTVSDRLWMYAGPAILIIGIIGNSMVLIASSHHPMRGTSTSVYLRFMAVADLFALVTGVIPDWVTSLNGFSLKELHPVACKVEKFLSYTSSDASIWICVAFTLDRFFAVCFPIERHAARRRRNGTCCGGLIALLGCGREPVAVLYAILAIVAAVVKNAHVMWTRGTEYQITNSSLEKTVVRSISRCGYPNEDYSNFEKFVRPWLAFASMSAVPFCVISFCNVFIVREMLRMRRVRHDGSLLDRNTTPMTSTPITVSACVGGVANTPSSIVFQTTALCLSASFCFLICIMPSMVLLIGKPYWNVPPNETYSVVKSISNQIFYVNHSINFFLYCIAGKRFRSALREACCVRCSAQPPATIDCKATAAVAISSRRASMFVTPSRLQATAFANNGPRSCPSTPTGTRHSTLNTVKVQLPSPLGKLACTAAVSTRH